MSRPRTGAWTIGYQGRTLADALDLVRYARVPLLMDVRDRPQSRTPGFSRSPLARTLESAGLHDGPRPDPGTPAPMRTRYKRTGDLATFRREFEAILAAPRSELDGAAGQIHTQRTALFCFERDPSECHRSVRGARLARCGISFSHRGVDEPRSMRYGEPRSEPGR